MSTYDFIVIGSGPSGKRAAIQCAKLGKSVLVVEKGREIGGVSVHTGTIPSKTLRETALNLSGWRERHFYGRSYRAKGDIHAEDLLERLTKTLRYEVDVLEHQFTRNRVDTVRGTARFTSANQIDVELDSGDVHTYEAGKFLLAVGTVPFRPAEIPFDGTSVLDSDEMLLLPTLPRSLIVIGAGVIGVEYATIFNALDVNVTIVEPRGEILTFLDSDIVGAFMHQMRDRGMTIRLGCKAEKVEKVDGKIVAHIGNQRIVRADMLLFAAGRVGATADIGLDKLGLETDHRGRVSVDPNTFQTEVPHIYAAGDVIGFPSLASTSMEQGRIAACHACGVEAPAPPEHFPYGIYAVPEISTCGMTEEEVKARGIPYEIGIARFDETSRGHIMGVERGMMKLIFSIKSRRLLGTHIIGEGATELVHIGQAVLNLKGTLDYFLENAFNYPTLAEAYKIAALDAHNRMPA
ncbi:Si-specific NAD(P)(+) transhydrogenase [Rhodobacteraceae bacterium NNCM2]|nr:Si-specific NAD(P)(+) transhydrogenase [Coraliihabitans acroporae]